ncbi:MAG: ABC transporter permease [Thermoplasmata archaeon]|nr:ABC transporter permease [Thermoplasmata archaeon]
MISLKKDILTDFEDIGLSVQFELRKHYRRNRFTMTALVALLLPLLFYIVPVAMDTDFADTADEFASGNVAFVTLLIILSGAIFAGDSIASETEKRTGLMLYPTPQRRNTIFIGKYLAALIPTMGVVSIYYLVTALEITQVYGAAEISSNFVKSYLIALLYSASVVGIIFFFSSIMERSIVATLLGFFSLMMIMPIVSNVLSMVDVNPWFMVTHSANLISDVFAQYREGGFGPGNDKEGFGGGFSPEFGTGILVMTTYAVVSFIAALGIANVKKMEG